MEPDEIHPPLQMANVKETLAPRPLDQVDSLFVRVGAQWQVI